ncbi:serine/threonine-protein kinase [Fodinicola acaciae]|uniref:serine/threonine-protein kinase n=1 Tax=Fodinicola acaciae TaxID=2681555 RepID=UPI0013D0779C|nr:serine/threonine-protein kinase [Fodinicola acaciae]
MTTGRLIAQRYRLEERLGAGGMGVVWRATDLELRRTVALKRSHTGDAGQIRREARIGAGLTDAHVVTVYDVVMDGDERWLVMEYLPSRSLDELLAAGGPLPPEQVRRIGADLAGALAAMHAADITHRDIKPANTLVGEDGTAKLSDLGIARWSEATVTGGAQAAGTAGYLAPEVANGHEATPAADVFSLGATLYAAATGRSPWGSGEAGPYAQLRRAAAYDLEPLTGELAPVLGALMAKRADRRPTARQAIDLLTGVAPAPPHKRQWRLAVSIGAAVVVVLLAAGLLTTFFRQAPQKSADLLGDPRTADPCALLVPNSLARFGKVALEPNYGNFNHCDLVVDTTGKGDIVDVALELRLPDEYPAEPSTPGKLGQVQADPPTENRCKRTIPLPNLYRVVIFARQVNNKPAELCGAAEAVALAAYGKLAQGPIPRRTSFEADSTASVDACRLLTGAAVKTAIGRAAPAEPDYGNWTCYWQNATRQVTIEFGREWPLEDDPPDGARISVGGRLAFMDTSEDGECDVTVVHRRYTPIVASEKGTPRERDETVTITLEDKNITDGTGLCPDVTAMAQVAVSRLPR